MSDVTRILQSIEQGDPQAAEKLLPLVYEELRKLAAAKLAMEKPGQTLQATALVHEAYVRLVGGGEGSGFGVQGSGADKELGTEEPKNQREAGNRGQKWDSRGHFFAAAAEAMRRILVESARRKQRLKHGGEWGRKEFAEQAISSPVPTAELLAVDEALNKLESTNAEAASLVKLRYFAGFTIPEAAEKLGISARKANQIWAYARAWLAAEIGEKSSSP
jgi:RNA polymerase sigma factor (sigma-70 family)